MKLDDEMLRGDADCKQEGRFCRMIKNGPLQQALQAVYGRPHLCLKVNKQDNEEAWEWSDPYETAVIQNIGALCGCAPRVYDVMPVRGGVQGMVMDWAPAYQTEGTPTGIERLLQMIREYKIGTRKVVSLTDRRNKWDISANVNWAGDWYLDWGGYYLTEPEAYKQGIIDKLKVHIATQYKGQPAETTYQSLPELGITGDRDTLHRLDVMGWDEIEWDGADVLDIGSNLGAFCFEAAECGARRVVGVDVPFIAEPMRHAANWLHKWNVDFYGANLPAGGLALASWAGLDGYDVVLALSVCRHIGGYQPWIADLCKRTLILETHGDESPAVYEAALKRDFQRVDLVGYTTDVKRRGVFICEKGG